jgi:hypothetical protein
MPPRSAAKIVDKLLIALTVAGAVLLGWVMTSSVSSGLHLWGAIGVVAVGAITLAIRTFSEDSAPGPTIRAADLRLLVAERSLPFSVCTSCRVVIDLPHAFSCPQCDSMETCIRGDAESERAIALAAIGTDD